MNTKYFRDDNAQRAREITSPRPLSVPFRYNHKQYFTPEEKRTILSRVKEIGVLRTAIEFGMNKKIIMKWLNAMDSQTDSDFIPSTSDISDTPDEEANEKFVDDNLPQKEVKPVEDNISSEENIANTEFTQDLMLKIENAILKEKVKQLTEHVNKLRDIVKILG